MAEQTEVKASFGRQRVHEVIDPAFVIRPLRPE